MTGRYSLSTRRREVNLPNHLNRVELPGWGAAGWKLFGPFGRVAS